MPGQKRGGKWAEHRTLLNGMFWVLNSGAQWRDMPERYGPWETVYGRYRRWTREGLFDNTLHALHVSLDGEGRIDWGVLDVDGSNIRAHRSTAGAALVSKKQAPRARRPRPGTIPRRLWLEASSCDRSCRHAAWGRWSPPGRRTSRGPSSR